jgi:hypothetical protein
VLLQADRVFEAFRTSFIEVSAASPVHFFLGQLRPGGDALSLASARHDIPEGFRTFRTKLRALIA